MTFSLRLFAMLAAATALPVVAQAGVGSATGPAVTLRAPATASAYRPVTVSCAATDAAGVASIDLEAIGPDGAAVALATDGLVTSVTSPGTSAAQASFKATAAGAWTLRCRAAGLSAPGAIGVATAPVNVAAAQEPQVSALVAPAAAALGKAVAVSAVAVDPEGGPLTYAWSASAGTIAGTGASATFTAPDQGGPVTLTVTVTDDQGLSVTKSATVEVALSVFQDALAAKLAGPRKVAATPDGDLFVADAAGRLHTLTRRGERMATTLENVIAVAAGTGIVFAGTRDAQVLKLDPRTGRVLGRLSVGRSEAPVGLAYDDARGTLWMAFASGYVEARTADGQVLAQVSTAGAEQLVRVRDVAVDPAGTVWVVQDLDDKGAVLRGYDAATGAYRQSITLADAGQVRIAGAVAARGGLVYAADLFGGRVQVLDAKGALVASLGAPTAGNSALRQPAGLSFMADGSLVVANMDANRLDRYGVDAALPACPGDSDCDGLPDDWELAHGLNPNDPTDALADPDGDGLNNAEEYAYGTDPYKADTDGDGFSDGQEVLAGFNPLDPDDHRPLLAASNPAPTEPGVVELSASVQALTAPGACSTSWKQVGGPAVTLKGATTATPTFVGRAAADYSFQVSAQCDGQVAKPQTVAATVLNVAPLADGGRLVTAPVGARISLSGAASTDANGDPLTFYWDQMEGPAVAGHVDGVAAGAQLPQAGYYLFRLGVDDPAGAEGAAEVPVLALDGSFVPAAAVETPVAAAAGGQVFLDASGSARRAGAAFEWEQLEGTYVELADAASATPGFVPPYAGRYSFAVRVVDQGVRSPPARVDVYVAPAGAALPVARASGPALAAVGAAVTLDGSGSTAGTGSALSYSWRQVAGPAAGLSKPDRAGATAYFFQAGSYAFELVVADLAAESTPATVRIEARADGKPIPVAAAKAQPTALVGQLVTLDGRASTGATAWRWTQVAGPWVVLAPGPVAAFQPTGPGRYAFELEVDDGKVRSAPARVEVVVTEGEIQ